GAAQVVPCDHERGAGKAQPEPKLHQGQVQLVHSACSGFRDRLSRISGRQQFLDRCFLQSNSWGPPFFRSTDGKAAGNPFYGWGESQTAAVSSCGQPPLANVHTSRNRSSTTCLGVVAPGNPARNRARCPSPNCSPAAFLASVTPSLPASS